MWHVGVLSAVLKDCSSLGWWDVTCLCPASAVPENCCGPGWRATDTTWWWFACVMLIVLPLLVATIKHCRSDTGARSSTIKHCRSDTGPRSSTIKHCRSDTRPRSSTIKHCRSYIGPRSSTIKHGSSDTGPRSSHQTCTTGVVRKGGF